jgi:hypothetical protein
MELSYPNLKKFTAYVLISAITVSILTVAAELELGAIRRACICISWLLWAVFTVSYPLFTFKSGVVITQGGTTRRTLEPKKYWVGFFVYNLLCLAVFAVITFVSWYFWFN